MDGGATLSINDALVDDECAVQIVEKAEAAATCSFLVGRLKLNPLLLAVGVRKTGRRARGLPWLSLCVWGSGVGTWSEW